MGIEGISRREQEWKNVAGMSEFVNRLSHIRMILFYVSIVLTR